MIDLLLGEAPYNVSVSKPAADMNLLLVAASIAP